jgi:hypothetical protein
MNHKQLQLEEYLSILGITHFFKSPRGLCHRCALAGFNQNKQIMQNKANFNDAIINVSSFVTSKYVKLDTLAVGKNKAKQTQFYPP